MCMVCIGTHVCMCVCARPTHICASFVVSIALAWRPLHFSPNEMPWPCFGSLLSHRRARGGTFKLACHSAIVPQRYSRYLASSCNATPRHACPFLPRCSCHSFLLELFIIVRTKHIVSSDEAFKRRRLSRLLATDFLSSNCWSSLSDCEGKCKQTSICMRPISVYTRF